MAHGRWTCTSNQHCPLSAVAKLLCLEDHAEQVAIGTLYKDMKLKPTVLKEYTENRTMAAQLGADNFIAADDSLCLEDESARIKLVGDAIDVHKVVTGIVVAVRGVYDAHQGVMHISAYAFAGALVLPSGLFAAPACLNCICCHVTAPQRCATVQSAKLAARASVAANVRCTKHTLPCAAALTVERVPLPPQACQRKWSGHRWRTTSSWPSRPASAWATPRWTCRASCC